MIAGQVGVKVDDNAALVVLGHGPELLGPVNLLVARGETPPAE